MWWNPEQVKIELLSYSAQVVHCHVHSLEHEFQFLSSFVHADTNKVLREHCWEFLKQVKSAADVPWLILGDFNCTYEEEDYWPMKTVRLDKFEEITNLMGSCEVADLEYTGCRLTWNNSKIGRERTEKKLDRALVNDSWGDALPLSKAYFDIVQIFDHSPIIVTINEDEGRNPFHLNSRISGVRSPAMRVWWQTNGEDM